MVLIHIRSSVKIQNSQMLRASICVLYVCRLTVLEVSNLDWLDFSWNLSSKSRCHVGWALLSGGFGKESISRLIEVVGSRP